MKEQTQQCFHHDNVTYISQSYKIKRGCYDLLIQHSSSSLILYNFQQKLS